MSHTHAHEHHHDIDFKKAFTVTKEAGSQVKIVGEIPFTELQNERKGAIKALGANVELDGFRKGNVPENILVKRIGEMAILGEMAERAISHMYPHIIEAHDIDPIGHPKIEITKLAPENPLGISLTVATMPEVTLPDYKKLASSINKDKESKEVTEEEVEKQISEILRQKMAYDRIQAKAVKKAEGAESDTETTDEAKPKADTVEDFSKQPLPELTDELVKELGQPGQFTDVADFKSKIKEHLTIQKGQDVEGRHRAKITDAIIAGSTIELPQILIDSELGQMFAQMEEDLSRSGLKMDDYLSHIKKTKDDLKTEWTPAAEKRAKLQLILNEIAKKDKIVADAELVKKQVDEILKQYKDADPYRVGIYVTSVLTNEAVMKTLEAEK
ncbi:MAG: trigger factor [Candidatus Paceibacterota bacterium]